MAKGFFTQGIVVLFDRAPTLDAVVRVVRFTRDGARLPPALAK